MRWSTLEKGCPALNKTGNQPREVQGIEESPTLLLLNNNTEVRDRTSVHTNLGQGTIPKSRNTLEVGEQRLEVRQSKFQPCLQMESRQSVEARTRMGEPTLVAQKNTCGVQMET